MMKVAVYPSDHGFGHLSRQLGWVERVPWKDDDRVFIINRSSESLVEPGLVKCLRTVARNTHVGLIVSDTTLEPDQVATGRLLDGWRKGMDRTIVTEAAWLKENAIDAVVTDISPVPIAAADRTGIPSLALSSFTWHWIYSHLVPDHPVLGEIKEMYKLATDAYVLPLTEDMDIFPRRKRIPLIARMGDGTVGTKKKDDEKGKKTKNSKVQVFVSMGRSVAPKMKGLGPGFSVIAPKGEYGIDIDLPIPSWTKNITPYLAQADFAVIKTGYSLVSECICLHKPFIGLRRGDMIEDRFTGKTVEGLGIAKTVAFKDMGPDSMEAFDWKTHAKAYDRLDARFRNEGWHDVEAWLRG